VSANPVPELNRGLAAALHPRNIAHRCSHCACVTTKQAHGASTNEVTELIPQEHTPEVERDRPHCATLDASRHFRYA
jgi:hypothetical protein